MKAGFAEIDITPPVGTRKIGWLKYLTGEEILDPLFARIAVFENAGEGVGLIQLDTLSVRWTQVDDIRRRIESRYGFPGRAIMVSATHNHAGPAVANCGRVPRDEEYIETLVEKCVAAFGDALERSGDASIGFRHTYEFRVGFNRRVIMRDGTARTHGSFSDPDALCFEGPIDPEVAVVAARNSEGRLIGCLVNFACHPAHHGGGTGFSAGFPGVLAAHMKREGCPVTLYLNGAYGNIATSNPMTNKQVSMEDAGARLHDDVTGALSDMDFASHMPLETASTTAQLPYRSITREEIEGTVRGAQRFVDPQIYDDGMENLVRRIRQRRTQPAEVQVVRIGNMFFAGIPAEYFVEFVLRIKEEVHPGHALVVGGANGMVGYVPTKAAFSRGGYETTFAASSRMAPGAGDMLADAAVALIRDMYS